MKYYIIKSIKGDKCINTKNYIIKSIKGDKCINIKHYIIKYIKAGKKTTYWSRQKSNNPAMLSTQQNVKLYQ